MSQTLMGSGPVLLERDEGVARIRLNRPDAANGLDLELLTALHDALLTVHGDPAVRAVLLSGEGRHFSAGGDIKTFASKGEALPDYLREATTRLSLCASAMLHLGQPVVTAVQGYAAGGGGFGLVCASDIVIAARSATFLLGATRVAMAPDAGGSALLPRLVGLRKAMDIALRNPQIGAAEALQIGLITQVVDDEALEATAIAAAAELAAGPPRALAETKRLIYGGVGIPIDAQLPDESRTVSALSGTADAREGLAAVIERRAPRFTGD